MQIQQPLTPKRPNKNLYLTEDMMYQTRRQLNALSLEERRIDCCKNLELNLKPFENWVNFIEETYYDIEKDLAEIKQLIQETRCIIYVMEQPAAEKYTPKMIKLALNSGCNNIKKIIDIIDVCNGFPLRQKIVPARYRLRNTSNQSAGA